MNRDRAGLEGVTCFRFEKSSWASRWYTEVGWGLWPELSDVINGGRGEAGPSHRKTDTTGEPAAWVGPLLFQTVDSLIL